MTWFLQSPMRSLGAAVQQGNRGHYKEMNKPPTDQPLEHYGIETRIPKRRIALRILGPVTINLIMEAKTWYSY